MRKAVPAFLGLSVLALAGVAHASSPAAWTELRIKSDRACLVAAQDLRGARITAYSADFQAVTVSTVEGFSRGRADRGASSKLTCVYDKRSDKAQAFELQARR